MSLEGPSGGQRAMGFAMCAICGASVAVAACQERSNGASADPAPSGAPNDVRGEGSRIYVQGELGRAADYSMSVDGVKDCPLGSENAPRKGFEKIGIEVDLQGNSDREVPANAFYATMTDPSGEHYPATLAGCEPALPSAVLAHGGKAHGFITFAVPRLARKLELRYAPPVVGQPAQELRFAVAR